MSDTSPRERSLTSACGNVTVTITDGSAPKVALAEGAVRMFSRDLAELVAATAREAADAARAEIPEPADEPSMGAALTELIGLRDSLSDRGLAAIAERRRSQLESPEDRSGPQGGQPAGSANLALHPAALEGLNAAIQVWERFQNAPPGTGKDDPEPPVGRAKSESRLVTIESTLEHPISSVVLSKHACEVGPKALGRELTETAAAAAADLAGRQDEYFSDLGLPIAPGEAADMVDRSERLGADAAVVVTAARDHHERITRMFYEGGHFA